MTLTQAAIWTKWILFFSILLLIVLIVAPTVYQLGMTIQNASVSEQSATSSAQIQPQPPSEKQILPDKKFGLLPKIILTDKKTLPASTTFSLSPAVEIPQLPILGKVYFVPRTNTYLLNSDTAKTLATSLGFPNGPQTASAFFYTFANDNEEVLTIDHSQATISFETETNKVDNTPQINPSPEPSELIEQFKNYLATHQLLTDELKTGPGKVIAANSTTLDISLWPLAIENVPVITSDINKGIAVATREISSEKVVKLKYKFWKVDLNTFSTYPLKTATQAFSEVAVGKASLLSIPGKIPSEIQIASVYLAYFQPEQYTPYLQPVFVFEGKDFAAIVQATSD